ncbi:MAG: hypothetical protein ACK4PH_02100 [Aquincola tertiaricarbonis]|uniref:hypothetical protein n=1 Tax=Aquincola TaxID=391952 RepID=UPI0006153FB8|nr:MULTISPECIES: hypothetical protein [Aquincola]MCR5868593.1 hypothetical protein [Aquincola sp. J276]
MTTQHTPSDLPLDERIRRAERDVMLHDRRLLQRIDDVSRQTRVAARSGGRVALIGVGALATAWIAWRVVKAVRHDPRAEARARARQEAYRYGHALPPGALPPGEKPGLFGAMARLGLILAPFVLPARSPAAAAASAFAPGGWWPMRIFRIARTAMDWKAAREAKRATRAHNARAARAETAPPTVPVAPPPDKGY